jgi:hypothetical protein
MHQRLKWAAKCGGDHDIVVGQVVAPAMRGVSLPSAGPVATAPSAGPAPTRTEGKA